MSIKKTLVVMLSMALLLLTPMAVWAADQPDLAFTSAVITSRTVTQVNYSYTFRNYGTATIPDLYYVCIQNFYSANTIFADSGDVAAGGSILGIHRSLAPGESYSGTFAAYGAVPAGMNYLTFQVDWGNYVTESNETNNTVALTLLPDLIFTSAVITSKTDTQVNYSYTIKNNGGDTIPDLYNVSIQNFYSANTIFNDSGDVAAGGSILGVHLSLAPGQSYSGTFAGYGAVPAGMNYLTFKIDWGGIITEYNESNNTRALALYPDLIFTSAAVTSRTATQVNYSYTIRNNGGVTIPDLYNVCIQNFYSANTIFADAGDVAAGGSILGVHQSLAPGQSYSGTFAGYGAVPAGMNYLTFQIDWGNYVTEMSETNNTRALALLPDLIFTSAAITSKTATQVNYTYTIKNNGGDTIPDLYYVAIQNFYSANTIFNDSGDVAAGGSILGIHLSLAPGQSYSGTFAAYGAVPAGMPYVTAQIDWGNSITEASETNNNLALLIP